MLIIAALFLLGLAGILVITLWKGKSSKKPQSSSIQTPKISKPKLPQLNEEQKQVLKENNNIPTQRYIKPTSFDMNTFSTPQPAASNLCNNKVLYPVNGLGVNYDGNMPQYCSCMEFIQPP